MWIINQPVRNLVARIDATADGEVLDQLLLALVSLLHERCSHPEVIARYASYDEIQTDIARLPIDSEGYVVGFDPLAQEDQFVNCWRKYGIIVGLNVVSPEICARTIARMGELVLGASEGQCDLDKPETWDAMPVDDAGVPIASRGFFEIYHDDALAQLRQSVRVYLHYVLIWGRADLWTTFDRLGIKLPGHAESKGLPLHVDQNPNIHPNFRTVQGVLALADCPRERGTFVGVPGSKSIFGYYGSMAKNAGEYVELDQGHNQFHPLADRAQHCPLRAGSLISWDSRTTHANSANLSDQTRFVAYIAYGVARQDDPSVIRNREEGFASGLGTNVRDALMHASKKPRYTNPHKLAGLRRAEQLTSLGRLIYGQQRYEKE